MKNSYIEFEEFQCVTCSIAFCVPNGYIDNRRRDGKTFNCPNGHEMTFRETEGDRIRRERDQLKQKLAQKDDEIKAAWATANKQAEYVAAGERKLRAARGQITKIKRRASNGVCPCCNRTFSDLARHMHSKHPGFVTEPDASEHTN